MYTKVKLSKRQIKEDKFTAFMLNAKHQFLENWQFYIIGVIVIILIITAVTYYINNLEAKDREASERLARALMDYRNGNNQVTILNFNQILEDFPDNNAAERATYLLGKVNYESKNYSEAIRYFEMYLSKYKKNILYRSSSLAGIASCYENQGNYLDAAKQFVAAYNEDPDGPLIGDYLISSIRNYLNVSDIENARKYLDIIKEKFKGTDLEKRSIRLFNEKSRN